ncbi:dihydrolipoyl dehydrogenase [Candidatus Peregrinibacteria bacterium]|nr:dihydrolipoyl dehydrogenase [Candidatus Peregrinibacteria bacterium]
MKKYDVIVIGSGSGMNVVDEALRKKLKVALIEKGPLGGTCLNVGCIPSKMLVYPADRIMEIKEAKKLGIKAAITNIDFKKIMQRMHKVVNEGREQMKKEIKNIKKLDFYTEEGKFTDEYTLEVEGKKIKGNKIFIACGARPFIPPIKGIDKIDYYTNENILNIEKPPKEMIIIGGGYISVEYAHFFSAVGTKITILQSDKMLVPHLEPEIAGLLEKELKKRTEIRTGTKAVEVKKEGKHYLVTGEKKSGKKKSFKTEKIMVATGRKPNTDILQIKNTGVKTDEKGFIKTNKYLETNKKNIWAFGDVTGKQMFTHVANKEAEIAWKNASSKRKEKMDYSAIPFAVFTWPQIASVGITEKEAEEKYDNIITGKAYYSDIAKGDAMVEKKGFAKAMATKTNKLLGFHVIGPHAPILIQEVTNSIATKSLKPISKGLHIHPALTELITATLNNIQTKQ